MKRFLLFIVCLVVLAGCAEEPSETALAYEENNEIIGEEIEERIGDISETVYDSVDRDNPEAEEMTISPVPQEGAEVVPPEGRYVISGNISGRIVVTDEGGELLVEEVIDEGFGVGSVTVDLNGNHTVFFDGVEHGFLSPAPTEFSNQLSAGIWEVGKDIKGGSYSMMSMALGDLIVYEEGESPRVYEFLDTSPESMIDIELEDGQKLKVSGLALVEFVERE